ncbi:signal peptidase I [Myxococcota bacterium]|nr:signal peptidase I [Myxococcota bacterium]
MTEAPAGPGAGRRGRRLGGGVMVLAGLVVLGRLLLFDLRVVAGGAMLPGLVEGQALLLRRPGPVRVGDVVVVHLAGEEERFVKRVVAGPGSRVEEVDGRLLVDGRPLATGRTLQGPVARQCPAEEGAWVEEGASDRRWWTLPGAGAAGVVQVPADHWFVAGDDRVRSRDSRHWGALSREEIDGVLLWALPGPPACP